MGRLPVFGLDRLTAFLRERVGSAAHRDAHRRRAGAQHRPGCFWYEQSVGGGRHASMCPLVPNSVLAQ